MRRPWLWFAVLFVVCYFAAASWITDKFHPYRSEAIPNVAGAKLLLKRPFGDFIGSEFAVIALDHGFVSVADTADSNFRSPVVIYENNKPLGPGHSTHRDIGQLGLGRFSHWHYIGTIFLFSSSDNTDPRTNGRSYWAVKPDEAATK